MPSENSTFERIQREISEEIQREKEIKRLHAEQLYYNNNNNNNNHLGSTDTESTCSSVNGDAKSDDFNHISLSRAQSTSSLTNGDYNKPTNGVFNGKSSTPQAKIRIFAPNPQTKGMMQRFIKARGKLTNLQTAVNGYKNNVDKNSNNGTTNGVVVPPLKKPWVLPEFLEPTKVTIDPAMCVRKGFVPVEIRMRKEFQDMHVRELELRKERRRSQGDYYSLCDNEEEGRISSPEVPLRAAKSMAQLYTPEDFSEEDSTPSGTNSLKNARSLAELCEVEDDSELMKPSSLISKFETIIRKNQKV